MWAASKGRHEGAEKCVRLLLQSEAIEVNAKDVSLERALPQAWVSFHWSDFVAFLSFAFSATEIQLYISAL
jgi:hypothetical protein